MELSYGQLEATLGAHLQIHPDKMGTFRSRMKQLQRLSFPPGVNVGRGEKMRYSAAHLFQLVTAFELIALGMPAAMATDMVAKRWLNFSAGYGIALELMRRGDTDELIFLRIMTSSIIELQGETQRADYPTVVVEDQRTLADLFSRIPDRARNTYVVMCATDIAQNVIQKLKDAAQVPNALRDSETTNWRVSNPVEHWWMEAEEGWFWSFDVDDAVKGPPRALAMTMAELITDHATIAVQFYRHDVADVRLQPDEIKVLEGYRMAVPDGESFQLTRRGEAIAKMLRREQDNHGRDTMRVSKMIGGKSNVEHP